MDEVNTKIYSLIGITEQTSSDYTTDVEHYEISDVSAIKLTPEIVEWIKFIDCRSLLILREKVSEILFGGEQWSRVWASGEVKFYNDISFPGRINSLAKLQSVKVKEVNNRKIIFIEYSNVHESNSRTLLEENITYAYVKEASKHCVPRGGANVRNEEDIDITIPENEVRIFSSLTQSTNPLHEDKQHCLLTTGREELVVHTPLLVACLVSKISNRSQSRVESFNYRSILPFHANETGILRSVKNMNEGDYIFDGDDGRKIMSIQVCHQPMP